MENTKQSLCHFNMNYYILVKLTDLGMLKCVEAHNNTFNDIKRHTCFKEYKLKEDENSYHRFIMWQFMEIFGEIAYELHEYVDMNILIDSNYLNK